MTNTSATGGLLLPTTSTFLEDAALDDFIQAYIVGTTGIAATLVRPNWQPEPPDLPPFNTNWASFAVATEEGDQFVVSEHVSTGQGYDTFKTHETIKTSVQFYGPLARSNAKLLRDGLKVTQNLDYWRAQNFGYLSAGAVVALPSLLKERWMYRADFFFEMRREILRTYPILNLLSITATAVDDLGDSVTMNGAMTHSNRRR